jgi:hypothetical protein
MSPKKKPTQFEREQRNLERERQKRASQDDDLVSDTAATFSCLWKTTRDFLHQCQDHREGLEADIAFHRIALAIWQGREGQAEKLSSTLSEFLEARTRFLGELSAFELRFAELEKTVGHEHLDPVEHYRDIVRGMLFPEETRSEPS